MTTPNRSLTLESPHRNRHSVLVVDDSPSNLLLVRLLLKRDGFIVNTAEDGNLALTLLETASPSIILFDLELPDMDGLEFARRVTGNPGRRNIPMIALSSSGLAGDEQRAMAAGCQGYITKPIDSRTFAATIRVYIERSEFAGAPVLSGEPDGLPPELEAIRDGFVEASIRESLLLLGKRLEDLGDVETRSILHRWAGTGGTMGFPGVTRYAREAEDLLRFEGPENRQLARTVIRQIAAEFDEASPAMILRPIPSIVAAGLTGARVALVGLNEAQAAQIADALEHADAFQRRIADAGGVDAERIFRSFDLIVYHAARIEQDTWNVLRQLGNAGKQVVISATRELMPEISAGLQGRNIDFVLEPWDLEELLLRASLLLYRKSAIPAAPHAAPKSGSPMVLAADDDPTVTSLLKATLRAYGIECATASDGGEALAAARSKIPDAIVLDIRMPGMDGFEVLAALRQDKQLERIPVILLSSLQHETDVIRGFGLGADDYVIKPFSPMELVARLRRLLSNCSFADGSE